MGRLARQTVEQASMSTGKHCWSPTHGAETVPYAFPSFPPQNKKERKRCIAVDTDVGQASREVLDEKVAKDPTCRTGMAKLHSTCARRVVYAIQLESVGLDYHSSEIPAPETDVVEKCWMAAAHGKH